MPIENCNKRLTELYNIATKQEDDYHYVKCDDVDCAECPLNIARPNDIFEVKCLLTTITEQYDDVNNSSE
jgi:hypothetical protein